MLAVKQNVFSTGSLVLVMVKKKQKKNKTKSEEMEKKKKKVVVPNATMQIPPHCCHLVEVQVLGKVDHREQRPNGNSWGSRAKRRRDRGGVGGVCRFLLFLLFQNGIRGMFSVGRFFFWGEMTARKKKNQTHAHTTTISSPDFSRFYKKHTGPTSRPNSWSGAPTSIGAISMMGRRDVFVVL